MKIADDKLTLSITFNPYETRLIRAARKILFPPAECLTPGQDRRMISQTIRHAIVAWCRAVIRNGGCKFPHFAELREETPFETIEREAGLTPGAGIDVLTTADLHYCELEAIEPDDYRKAKYGK